MKKFLLKLWPLFALMALGIAVARGDMAQLAVQAYALSVIAFVLLAAFYILHDKKDRGLFPYIDLEDLSKKAAEDPMGAAIIFAAIIYLLTVILQISAVVK